MGVRRGCAVLMVFPLALTMSLDGQSPSATKHYVDPENGVSFEYPAAWTEEMGRGYGGDPLEEERGKDGKSPPVPKLRVGWVSYSKDEDEDTWYANETSFAYAVLPEKTAQACAERFARWDSEDGKPAAVVLNGRVFNVITYEDAGLGHSWSIDVYTTFRHGRCLGFSVGSNSSVGVDDPGLAKAAQHYETTVEPLKTLRVTQ